MDPSTRATRGTHQAAPGARVSVVIPTFDRVDRLRTVLAALASQTVGVDAMEVIVVSDGSTDGTDDYLRSGELPLPVVAVLQANQGPAAARNAGIRAATGRLVLFLDDDVVPAPGLVEAHLTAHGCLGPDVVVLGPMLTDPDFPLSPWVAWEQAMLEKQYEAMRAGRWRATARQFYTGNASIARHHLERIGGFDPSFRRAEDVELAYRLADAGLSFSFHPEAEAHHHAERSYRSWLDIAYTYGRNDVAFAQRGQTWLLPTLRREFDQLHPLVQWLVRTGLSRPALSAPARLGLGWLGRTAGRLGWRRVSRAALSAVYNLTYYRGIARALGDGSTFLDLTPAPLPGAQPSVRSGGSVTRPGTR